MRLKNKLIFVCVLLIFSVPAMADSIDPSSLTATLAPGESLTVTKTVTVEDAPPTYAPVDVFFLADSTGSMTGEIADVKASMAAILTATSGLGDVHYGVGEYRDATPPDYGGASDFDYELRQEITDDTTLLTSAIGALTAAQGGDGPEAQLFALHEVATDAATGWRDGSTRILVWFGDAPGHDEPGDYGLADPLEDARDALVAANITVEAIDVGTSSYGLDVDGAAISGQATYITGETFGTLYSGISDSEVGATIGAAIVESLEKYSTVSLDLSNAPAGVTVTSSPAGYAGDWERDVDRDFLFDVTFTGVTLGTYSFPIHALVDGGIVATEIDNITVPVPGAFLLGMLGLSVAGIKLRKRT